MVAGVWKELHLKHNTDRTGWVHIHRVDPLQLLESGPSPVSEEE